MRKGTAMLKAAGGFNTPLQQLFLLEERVRLAGAVLPEELDQHNRFHGVKCLVNGVSCVIDMKRVAEIIEDKHVTSIPGSRDWIEGVINFRGALVPVYNVNRYLALPKDVDKSAAGPNGPLIVARHGNELCAVRVDRVIGMQKFIEADFSQAGETGGGDEAIEHYVDGCIEGDGQTWKRLDIGMLLDTLTRENPREYQAGDEN